MCVIGRSEGQCNGKNLVKRCLVCEAGMTDAEPGGNNLDAVCALEDDHRKGGLSSWASLLLTGI